MLQTRRSNAAPAASAAHRLTPSGYDRAVLDGARDAVVCCTPDGVVTRFNAAAEALFGRHGAEVVGEPLQVVSDAGDARRWLEALGQAARGEAAPPVELEQTRPDGSTLDIIVLASPIWFDGTCAGVSFFVRDISARRAAERELARTRALLERHATELTRSNSDLEQFAYVASHDLSEPLRAITGMLALLREECADELSADAEEYIRRANGGAARMRVLIDDLLTYSRVGREQGDWGPVDTAALFDEVVSGLEASLGEAVAVSPLPVIDCSPSQMRQVLQNVLSNALKFNESARPRVELSAAEREGSWEFAATDNGIGIPDQYRERIFGVFKRLHTRDAYAGTGIGLAICERVVERHGGRMWVEAGRTAGARVCFTIPKSERPQDEQVGAHASDR